MRFKDISLTLQNLKQENITQTQIADALGYSVQTINKRAVRNSNFTDDEIKQIESFFDVDLSKKSTPNQEDCIIVDHIHINPSCGKGTSVYYDSDITPIKLGTQMLQSVLKVSHPKNLKVFVATGDSMTPVIESGDMLLIDTGFFQRRNIPFNNKQRLVYKTPAQTFDRRAGHNFRQQKLSG